MYKVIILPVAKQDIKDAAHWYNRQEKGLGKRFTRQVRDKIKHLQNNPKSVAIRYEDIRTVIVNVFPFMIHFSIDEQNKSLVIVAVYHTSLNPEKWKSRTKY